jgi:hypothetical protein
MYPRCWTPPRTRPSSTAKHIKNPKGGWGAGDINLSLLTNPCYLNPYPEIFHDHH